MQRHFIKMIGVGIFIIILFKTDIYTVCNHLKNIRPLPLIGAILLVIPQITLRAYRWHRLLVRSGIPCPLKKSIVFYFSSNYIGLITPGRLGEVTKALFLKQYHFSSFSYAMPGVIIDRISDLYALVLFSITGIWYFDILKEYNMILYSAGILIISLPLLILFRYAMIAQWIGRQLSKKFSGKWDVAVDVFTKGFKVLISPELINVFFITLLSYLMYFYQNYLLAHSLNLDISYFSMVQIISVATLIAYVPISIAGLGTREAILIFLFQQIDLTADKAFSFALLFNLVYIGFVGVIGFIIWWIFCSDKTLNPLKTE